MEDQTAAQPIVDVTTQLDYKEYKRYARFVHLRTKTILSLVFMSITYPLGLFLVLLPVYAVLRELGIELPVTVLSGILWGLYAFAALFVLHSLYVSVIAFRVEMRSWKKYQRHYEADSHEIFFEEYILTHKELPEVASNNRIRYEHYAQAVETKSAFYLTLAMDKNQHGILPKQCMTDDQIAALRDLFARKYGAKFKQYKKK